MANRSLSDHAGSGIGAIGAASPRKTVPPESPCYPRIESSPCSAIPDTHDHVEDSGPHGMIYLSPPHLSEEGYEQALVEDALASNWIAPVGPHLEAFEREFAIDNGSAHAVALSSGTAALHLALRLLGVGPGDDVFCSTLSFVASAAPILYLGAQPVFVDSERVSWNLDPGLLEEALAARARRNRLPKAIVAVDIYGQSADYDPILAACERYGVPLIEDAAEALGARYRDRRTGNSGTIGCFSLNGNKIITTSGGGMLVTSDREHAEKARYLAAQARESGVHYEHPELGYNYRLSNLLAAVGRGQLRVLDRRIRQRRANFEFYRERLGDLAGIRFMPEASFGRSTRWLTCLTIEAASFGVDRDHVRLALEQEEIESKPVWKPLHLQPLFAGCELWGGGVSEDLFRTGLCLPSGSNLTLAQRERIADLVSRLARPDRSVR